MKQLIPVSFTLLNASNKQDDPPESASSKQQCICPSCKKGLSNTVRIFRKSFAYAHTYKANCALVMKPCGHVVYKTCTETLVKPSSQCVVCDSALGAKDIIEMQRDGQWRLSSSSLESNTPFRNRIRRWRTSRNVQERDSVPRVILEYMYRQDCI